MSPNRRLITSLTIGLAAATAIRPAELKCQAGGIGNSTVGGNSDRIRAAYASELRLATTSAGGVDNDSHLARARVLARAYASSSRDSFLIRDVEGFAVRSPGARRDRVVADSLRQAGIQALTSDGVTVALRLWRNSLRYAHAANDKAAIAPAFVAIGAAFYRDGKLDSARTYVTKGRSLATAIGDQRTNANALDILASISKDEGNSNRALSFYTAASSIRQRTGDSRGQAADDNNIGLLAREHGDLTTATRFFNSALRINTADKRRSLVALNLSNLAGVASDMGQFARADSLFRAALSIRQQLREDAEAGFVFHDLGKLQMRRGDYDGAIVSFTGALRLHEKADAISEALAVRADLASAQNAIGHPETALITLKAADRLASRASRAVRADLAIVRGDLALSFGNYSEADAAYALAEQLYSVEGNRSRWADALYSRATVSYERADHSRALEYLSRARTAKASSRDRRSTALMQLLAASIYESQDNYDDAFRTLNLARNDLERLGDRAGESATLEMLGNLNLLRGAPRAAEQSFRKGIVRLGNIRETDIEWQLHAGRGRALRQLDLPDSAAIELNTAIRIAERSVARVGPEQHRFGLLADKWSTYSDLALLEQERGRPVDAFAISERLRAREMVDLLARGRVSRPGEFVASEQDARQRMSALVVRSEYRMNPVDRRDLPAPPAVGSTQGNMDNARSEHSLALIKLRESDVNYGAAVSGSTVTAAAISGRLQPDEALVEYMLGDSACAAFVITHDTLVALRLSMSHQEIARLVDFTRRAVEMPDGPGQKGFWAPPLRRLYRELVEPMEKTGILNGKRRLIIVPHGELHFLSFAALIAPGGNDFLVQHFDITYSPSATAWAQLRSHNRRSHNRRVLALAPHVRQLPGSVNEVRAISEIYRTNATIRTGSEASEDVLRRGIASAGTLHLATFGVLNTRNPLYSFIDLAPSATASGRLEVNKVYGLGMNGQVVILSACQSGVGSGINGQLPPGDDWVGFVQAFLQGGASSVVASLWPIDDRSTAQLMQAFHRRLAADVTPSSAIAAAQREMLRRDQTRAPFYWAAFVVNGN